MIVQVRPTISRFLAFFAATTGALMAYTIAILTYSLRFGAYSLDGAESAFPSRMIPQLSLEPVKLIPMGYPSSTYF